MPELILRHNLHGIDIDPRAVQIGALALWLRAQKSWQAQGLKATERPRIAKSNIVCAEPMPGEEDLRREFTAALQPRVLGQLVEVIFDKMKLAGEAGSLLKIEEEIKEVVARAKAQSLKVPQPEQAVLFPEMMQHKPEQRELFEVKDITDEEFWHQAEERIFEALKEYSEQAENGHTRRRLFVEDASRGFAFIDLCRKRFDVVVMNPPFGLLSTPSKEILFSAYPTAREEAMNAMILASLGRLSFQGKLGCIGNRTVFFLANHEQWRLEVFQKRACLDSFADLGHGVLDGALVETAVFVLGNSPNLRKDTIFLSALSSIDKKAVLGALCRLEEPQEQLTQDIRLRKVQDFLKIPGFRFSYSIPEEFLVLFSKYDSLDPKYGEVIVGLQTSDNERFLRLIWEVELRRIGQSHEVLRNNREKEWAFFAKGGEYSPYSRTCTWCVVGEEMEKK